MPRIINASTNYATDKSMKDAFFYVSLSLPPGTHLFDKFGDIKYVEFGFSSNVRDVCIPPADYTEFLTAEITELKNQYDMIEISLTFAFRVYLFDEDGWEECENIMSQSTKSFLGPYLDLRREGFYLPKKFKEKIYSDFEKFKEEYWEMENCLKNTCVA